MLKAQNQLLVSTAEDLCIDNDVIIGAHKVYQTEIAAEKHKTPYINISFCPFLIPSKSSSPINTIHLGSMMNRILWRLTKRVSAIKFLPSINQLRKEHGLKKAHCLFTGVCHSNVLNLIAASPALIRPADDWPSNTFVSGFLNQANRVNEGVVSSELKRFLDQGEAPIYIGFGSMSPNTKKQQLIHLNIITKAIKKLKLRAVIQMPKNSSLELTSDNQFFYLNKSPHLQVFPKCSMVIHHGGAGTTHTALLAQVSSIVFCTIDEQRYWGNLLHRLGVAPKVMDVRKLTTSRLVNKIKYVHNNTPMLARAKQLGLKLAQEDGVTIAVNLIEQAISSKNINSF